MLQTLAHQVPFSNVQFTPSLSLGADELFSLTLVSRSVISAEIANKNQYMAISALKDNIHSESISLSRSVRESILCLTSLFDKGINVSFCSSASPYIVFTISVAVGNTKVSAIVFHSVAAFTVEVVNVQRSRAADSNDLRALSG